MKAQEKCLAQETCCMYELVVSGDVSMELFPELCDNAQVLFSMNDQSRWNIKDMRRLRLSTSQATDLVTLQTVQDNLRRFY